MSQVNVTINGRQYRMACEDGQEGHILRLAKDLDQRIVDLREKFGAIGDMRLMVMAALTVADELDEAGRRLHDLQEQLNAQQHEHASVTDRSNATQAIVVEALETAAERIEGIAKALSSSVPPDH